MKTEKRNKKLDGLKEILRYTVFIFLLLLNVTFFAGAVIVIRDGVFIVTFGMLEDLLSEFIAISLQAGLVLYYCLWKRREGN